MKNRETHEKLSQKLGYGVFPRVVLEFFPRKNGFSKIRSYYLKNGDTLFKK